MSERLKEIDRKIEELKSEYENIKGTSTEVYARITGYFRSVDVWNPGKYEEYFDRKTYNTNKVKE